MAKKSDELILFIPREQLSSKELTSTDKLVIEVIRGLSHKEGYCYATNKTIADMLGISRDSVAHIIPKLEQKKIIKTEKKYKEKQIISRNIYIVDSDNDEFTVSEEKTKEKESKKIENKQLKAEFDSFWEIYPKKINMDTAYSSYRNWRRGRMYAGEMRQMSYDEIMMITNLYIEQWSNEHTDPQYIPDPAKFLNSRVYENLKNLKKEEI